jgi:hypothetical protein
MTYRHRPALSRSQRYARDVERAREQIQADLARDVRRAVVRDNDRGRLEVDGVVWFVAVHQEKLGTVADAWIPGSVLRVRAVESEWRGIDETAADLREQLLEEIRRAHEIVLGVAAQLATTRAARAA